MPPATRPTTRTEQYSPTRDMQMSYVPLTACARLRLPDRLHPAAGGSLDFTPISEVTITGTLNR